MEETSAYGTLSDYRTGDGIRPATRDEWLRSLECAAADGGIGVFFDTDLEVSVWVDGGPESPEDAPDDDEPLCWTCKHGKWDHLNGAGACGQCSLGCPAYAIMTGGGPVAAGLAYHCCGHCAHTIRTYSHLEPCRFGCANDVYSPEVELVAQYQMRRGPKPGDPFDADLWMHAAAQLLNGRPL